MEGTRYNIICRGDNITTTQIIVEKNERGKYQILIDDYKTEKEYKSKIEAMVGAMKKASEIPEITDVIIRSDINESKV